MRSIITKGFAETLFNYNEIDFRKMYYIYSQDEYLNGSIILKAHNNYVLILSNEEIGIIGIYYDVNTNDRFKLVPKSISIELSN